MTVIPELHPILEAWLLEGPLSAQIPAYVNRLERGRYAAQTRRRCLSAAAHFAHWMSMCSLPARELEEGCVDQFLRSHLPHCDCPRWAPRTPSDVHAAMVPMLEILRVEGVIAWPPAPSGPIADELSRYDAHMRDACGFAAGTRSDRLRIIERLLRAKFATRPVVVRELRTDDIRQFIADQLDALGTTSNAITIASTLRAYLRYRASLGDATQLLLAVITSPRTGAWRDSREGSHPRRSIAC
jgi:integrase/recombinase XerC